MLCRAEWVVILLILTFTFWQIFSSLNQHGY